MTLDDIDLDLCEALQANGRRSYRDLGDEVGLSAPAVRDRVRRLEERGVIVGYRAVIDPEAVGFPIQCVIRLSTGRADEGVDELLRSMPEVVEANRVTGSESHVVRAHVKTTSHLEDLFRVMWQAADSVTNIVTSSPVPRRPLQIGRALGRR
jgi:Lrp/AsnC family leucine-responsive transcriptional regulator